MKVLRTWLEQYPDRGILLEHNNNPGGDYRKLIASAVELSQLYTSSGEDSMGRYTCTTSGSPQCSPLGAIKSLDKRMYQDALELVAANERKGEEMIKCCTK